MNIYVGNLSWQMTDEDLRNLFEQHGAVGSAKIVKDKVSGRSKGFGFVEMENDTEAQAAITALYDSEVMGRKIIVNESQPKQQGGGGGGFKKRSLAETVVVVVATRKVAITAETAVVADSTEIINLTPYTKFKILPFGEDFFY